MCAAIIHGSTRAVRNSRWKNKILRGGAPFKGRAVGTDSQERELGDVAPRRVGWWWTVAVWPIREVETKTN